LNKTLPIADCQLPIEKIANIQSAIKNWQSNRQSNRQSKIGNQIGNRQSAIGNVS
jgi:hypothetical protein